MASKEAVESKLEVALDLAARGFWIFPIKSGQKLPPLVKFKEAATRDEQTIRDWWGLPHHQPNIGIYTGRYRDGDALVVIDVDTKKDGDGALFDLELAGKTIPQTYVQRTPSGGRHIVFRHPIPLRQGVDILGPGLDIRSRGGYILACGSDVDAGRYVVEGDSDVVDAPEWLVGTLNKGKSSRKTSARRDTAPDAPRAVGARDKAVQWLAAQPGAVQGDGGDSATYAVCAGILDYGLSVEECFDLLWGHPNIDESWNSRCQPAWSPDELRTKIDNALQYRENPVGSALPRFAPVGAVVSQERSEAEGAGGTEQAGRSASEAAGLAHAELPAVLEKNVRPATPGGYTLRLTGDERPTNRTFAAIVAKLF